jgi:flagellar export protein FliJ
MKNFQFRLDRVLDWRRTELEMEENRLRRLHAAVAAIDRERAGLESTRDEACQALLACASVDGAELQFLSGYRAAVKLQCARLDQKRRLGEQETAEQQQRLLAARRRLRLLENLKDRRLAEWKYETERQMEADAPTPVKRPSSCSS